MLLSKWKTSGRIMGRPSSSMRLAICLLCVWPATVQVLLGKLGWLKIQTHCRDMPALGLLLCVQGWLHFMQCYAYLHLFAWHKVCIIWLQLWQLVNTIPQLISLNVGLKFSTQIWLVDPLVMYHVACCEGDTMTMPLLQPEILWKRRADRIWTHRCTDAVVILRDQAEGCLLHQMNYIVARVDVSEWSPN